MFEVYKDAVFVASYDYQAVAIRRAKREALTCMSGTAVWHNNRVIVTFDQKGKRKK